jgi:hypothetical protein
MENYTHLMAVAVYCQYSPSLNHLPSRQSFHIRRWLFSVHNAFRAPIFLGQMRACPANIGLTSIMSTSNSFSVRFPRASTNDVSSRIGLKAFTFTDAFPGHPFLHVIDLFACCIICAIRSYQSFSNLVKTSEGIRRTVQRVRHLLTFVRVTPDVRRSH